MIEPQFAQVRITIAGSMRRASGRSAGIGGSGARSICRLTRRGYRCRRFGIGSA
jgi:hypothetical protein